MSGLVLVVGIQIRFFWATLHCIIWASMWRDTMLYWRGDLSSENNLRDDSLRSAPNPVTICPRALRLESPMHWR